MARTPTQTTAPAELIQVAPQAEQQLAALQDSALTHQQMDEVLAAGIDLGRLEAMDFVATIANSAILAIYENVKKSKAWRLLRNPESGDGRHFSGLSIPCATVARFIQNGKRLPFSLPTLADFVAPGCAFPARPDRQSHQQYAPEPTG